MISAGLLGKFCFEGEEAKFYGKRSDFCPPFLELFRRHSQRINTCHKSFDFFSSLCDRNLFRNSLMAWNSIRNENETV